MPVSFGDVAITNEGAGKITAEAEVNSTTPVDTEVAVGLLVDGELVDRVPPAEFGRVPYTDPGTSTFALVANDIPPGEHEVCVEFV